MKKPKILNHVPEVEINQTVNQDTAPHDSDRIRIPSSLPLTKDDSNFDPSWDWTLDKPQILFAQTQAGLQMFENVRLPYYADSGPAADDFNSDVPGVRDILPKDGWVLLFRDFGTPERGIAFPKFIIYNKFRGLLRLFYFNAHFPEAYTYGVVMLKKQSASGAFALLNFTDTNKSTLSDFDPEKKEVFIGRLEPITWNYADFLVVGFDPNLPDDAKFQFEITGVQESDISLEGNLTLNGVLKENNLVASKSGVLGELLTIGDGTGNFFKNLDALKRIVDDVKKEATLADITNVFSAGIALVKLFLTGSKDKQAQMLLNFKGEINLKGTIRLQGAIGSFLLRVPGARHLGDTDLPFYDKPLGLFNLSSYPTIDLKVVQKLTLCQDDELGPKPVNVLLPRRHEYTLRRPDVIINPDAGFTALIEAALLQPTGKIEFGQAGNHGYFALGKVPTAVDTLKLDCNLDPPIEGRRVAVRLTIRPKETVADFTPVSIGKIYRADYVISEVEESKLR